MVKCKSIRGCRAGLVFLLRHTRLGRLNSSTHINMVVQSCNTTAVLNVITTRLSAPQYLDEDYESKGITIRSEEVILIPTPWDQMHVYGAAWISFSSDIIMSRLLNRLLSTLITVRMVLLRLSRVAALFRTGQD